MCPGQPGMHVRSRCKLAGSVNEHLARLRVYHRCMKAVVGPTLVAVFVQNDNNCGRGQLMFNIAGRAVADVGLHLDRDTHICDGQRVACMLPRPPVLSLMCARMLPTKNRPCLRTRGPASVYVFVVCGRVATVPFLTSTGKRGATAASKRL